MNCLSNFWQMKDESADCHRHQCVCQPCTAHRVRSGSGREQAWLEATTLLSTAPGLSCRLFSNALSLLAIFNLQPLNHTLRRSGQSLLSSPFRLPSASAAIQGRQVSGGCHAWPRRCHSNRRCGSAGAPSIPEDCDSLASRIP